MGGKNLETIENKGPKKMPQSQWQVFWAFILNGL